MTIGASASSQKSKSNNKIDPTSLALFNQTYQPGVNALSGVNTGSYGGPLGAGLDAQQTQAAGMAQANAGVGQGALNQAITGAQNVGNYTPDQVSAGQVKGQDLSGYMNPYIDSVLNSGLGRLDEFRKRAMVGNSQAAGSGAWGGSRHGVADSLTNENFLDQAGSFISNLLQGGYDRATGLAQGDIATNLQGQLANQQANANNAALGLNAANSLAQFGGQQNAMGAADANLINSFGQQAQATQQNQNQMSYEEWMRQQQQPYQLAAAYGGLANTVPITVDNKSKGSSMGVTGSAQFSDYRLKTDIEHVLTDAKGRDWFDYRYIWQDDDEPKQRGVMAQQMLLTDPQAVKTGPGGFLMVDYGALH